MMALSGESSSRIKPTLEEKAGSKSFIAWKQDIAPVYDVDRRDDSEFYLGGRTWQFPRGFMHEAWGSSITLTRDKILIERHPIDQISMFFLVEGEVRAQYAAQHVSLAPGDIVFLDYGKTSTSQSTNFRAYTITVGRLEVPARGRGGLLHGNVVSADAPFGRVLNGLLKILVQEIAELDVHAAQCLFQTFIDFSVRMWPSREGLSSANLLDRAITIIRDELMNPKFAPPVLAQHLGVSRASLYAAFAPHGGVSKLMQNMRLDASLKELLDGQQHTALVKTVSERYAFKSAAHFSRAFASRFGRTPTQILAVKRQQIGGLTFAEWLQASGRDPSLEMIQVWVRRFSPE